MQLLPSQGGHNCWVDGVLLCNCYEVKEAITVGLMEFFCATVSKSRRP